MVPTIFNFIGFQLVWLANCLGAAAAYPWVGPVVTMIWLLTHFGFFVTRKAAESALIAGAMLFGYFLDSALVLGNWFEFPVHTQLGSPSTLWMVALWGGFASTLLHSMKWLLKRPVLASLLGAVFGPLAYLAGEKLGAIDLAGSSASVAVALEWAVAMPILIGMATWFDARFGQPNVAVERANIT